MEIPFYKKENVNDCGCAPVCLRMALGYFGIKKSMVEIYELVYSLGDVHYTLPWGMCIGASSVGLRATFISKNPKLLNDSSYNDIVQETRLAVQDIRQIVTEQLEKCHNSENISLIPWEDRFKELPEKIVLAKVGVVIPTVWWGVQPHNIVLTDFRSDKVFYHNPNTAANRNMSIKEFHKKWFYKDTDNDLLIISKEEIDLNKLV